MSKSGYYGDFDSLAHEREAYEQWCEANREPDPVPCYICGCTMHQESRDPRENICDSMCRAINKSINVSFTLSDNCSKQVPTKRGHPSAEPLKGVARAVFF